MGRWLPGRTRSLTRLPVCVHQAGGWSKIRVYLVAGRPERTAVGDCLPALCPPAPSQTLWTRWPPLGTRALGPTGVQMPSPWRRAASRVTEQEAREGSSTDREPVTRPQYQQGTNRYTQRCGRLGRWAARLTMIPGLLWESQILIFMTLQNFNMETKKKNSLFQEKQYFSLLLRYHFVGMKYIQYLALSCIKTAGGNFFSNRKTYYTFKEHILRSMHVTRNPRPLESKLCGLSPPPPPPRTQRGRSPGGAEHTSEGTAHTHQTWLHGVVRIPRHTICLISWGVTFLSFSITCVFYKWMNLAGVGTADDAKAATESLLSQLQL